MDILSIPLEVGTPFWSQETTLEGITYRLSFRYNQREGAFYLSIGDAHDPSGVDLVSSIKIITNKELTHRFASVVSPWPPGGIMAVSMTPDDSIAGLGDLGTRVVLVYLTGDFWTSVGA